MLLRLPTSSEDFLVQRLAETREDSGSGLAVKSPSTARVVSLHRLRVPAGRPERGAPGLRD